MKTSIGLVVPSLAQGGGVPAVARFVKDAALRAGRFDLRLVSLSTSTDDLESVRLVSPSSWLRGARTTAGEWEGLPFVHVGAVGGEFEFQRYRSRRVLAEVLADCDLIQVVCGSPAWVSFTRFRGRLTRPNFGAEVPHEIQGEGRTRRAACAARVQ